MLVGGGETGIGVPLAALSYLKYANALRMASPGMTNSDRSFAEDL
jgi:hypothetical protein